MAIELEIQRASKQADLPQDTEFRLWVKTALQDQDSAELTLRLVDEEEISQLNRDFRGKDRPTNVLSFPAEMPPGLEEHDEFAGLEAYLGDVILCAGIVRAEAKEQGKLESSHWAHLVIHGVLHLLGMDHQEPGEAEQMESREISLLDSLGIPNPYRDPA